MNRIILVSLSDEQIDLILKCISFTRQNFSLSANYKEETYILEQRLKEELRK